MRLLELGRFSSTDFRQLPWEAPSESGTRPRPWRYTRCLASQLAAQPLRRQAVIRTASEWAGFLSEGRLCVLGIITPVDAISQACSIYNSSAPSTQSRPRPSLASARPSRSLYCSQVNVTSFQALPKDQVPDKNALALCLVTDSTNTVPPFHLVVSYAKLRYCQQRCNKRIFLRLKSSRSLSYESFCCFFEPLPSPRGGHANAEKTLFPMRFVPYKYNEYFSARTSPVLC